MRNPSLCCGNGHVIHDVYEHRFDSFLDEHGLLACPRKNCDEIMALMSYEEVCETLFPCFHCDKHFDMSHKLARHLKCKHRYTEYEETLEEALTKNRMSRAEFLRVLAPLHKADLARAAEWAAEEKAEKERQAQADVLHDEAEKRRQIEEERRRQTDVFHLEEERRRQVRVAQEEARGMRPRYRPSANHYGPRQDPWVDLSPQEKKTMKIVTREVSGRQLMQMITGRSPGGTTAVSTKDRLSYNPENPDEPLDVEDWEDPENLGRGLGRRSRAEHVPSWERSHHWVYDR